MLNSVNIHKSHGVMKTIIPGEAQQNRNNVQQKLDQVTSRIDMHKEQVSETEKETNHLSTKLGAMEDIKNKQKRQRLQ